MPCMPSIYSFWRLSFPLPLPLPFRWIKVLSANPHHTDALTYLASLYYELKDFSKTRHTLHQILQQVPNHTDTHYRLAVLDYMQGNYKEAMETFSKVSVLQPGYKKTQSYLELTQRELLQQRQQWA